MRLGKVFVDSVIVGDRHRPLCAEAVPGLAESMRAIGLQQPIIVHLDSADAAHLIAGRHRLEAARQLGWEEIDATFIDGDEIDRELAELAENLLRVDLSKEQRDEHIRRYAELLEAKEARTAERLQSRQNEPIESKRADGRGHRQQGTAAKVAEATGLSKSTVQRALKRPDPEIERQQQEAARIRREQDRAQRAVASEEYAGWLLSQVDLDQLPTLISWIEASPPRDVIAALRRLSNETPVMDARYGGDDDLPAFLDRRGRP